WAEVRRGGTSRELDGRTSILRTLWIKRRTFFFFKQKTAYDIGLGIPAEPLFRSKPPLPALSVKLSKYNVDDVALGVCKTGAEEAGVTEVRTSLSEKKFELWREIKV